MKQPKRSRAFDAKDIALLFGGAIILGSGVGVSMHFWQTSKSSERVGLTSAATFSFSLCAGSSDTNCVVDGDTIWLEGVKIRVADIDTPEISQPRCDYEYELGIKARDRLVTLLNQGEFSAVPIGNRDEDQYGRKLRVLKRDGRSLGDQLVAEGLARTWTGRREPWC